jgi:hypothetical protein
VSRSSGYYETASWPGARWYWGATATSLPVAAGTIRVDEIERGRIDHALALDVKRVRRGVHAWPAQRNDGRTGGAGAIPEGARFRLDPRIDVDRLDLNPFMRMVARAAQRYGLVVRDKSTTVALFAEDPAPFGRDPYERLMGREYPARVPELFDGFPWERLQLVEMGLCVGRTAAERRRAIADGSGGCPRGGDPPAKLRAAGVGPES